MALSSLLSKGAIKLFHGAKKDFDSFDSDFAAETAFGKGFSFTPEKNVAESYANITPSKLRKLYGKDHVESAIERKKDGTPILYEVEADIKDSEVLAVRKNFEDQDKEVQKKLKNLIEKEGLNIEDIDLTKPKFWRQILNLTDKDADKLFSKYGIKASLKDAQDSKLKQVGGKIEYTVYDPTVLKIKDKKFLEKNKKNTGGEITMHCDDKKRMKKAVGSVAQKAAEGADSLLSEARKDVVAARSPEPAVNESTEDMAEAMSKVKGSAEETAEENVETVMKDTTKLVNSFEFSGGNKKMDRQFIMESLSEVQDSSIVETKQGVAEFITDLHRTQMDEEGTPLLGPDDFKKLNAFVEDEPREAKAKGGEVEDELIGHDSEEVSKEDYKRFRRIFPDEDALDAMETHNAYMKIKNKKYDFTDEEIKEMAIHPHKRDKKSEGGKLSPMEQALQEDVERYLALHKDYEQSYSKAKTDEARKRIMKRFQQYEDTFEDETVIAALKSLDAADERDKKAFGGIAVLMSKAFDDSEGEGSKGGILSRLAKAIKHKAAGQAEEASISNLEGADPIEPSNNASIGYAEGGEIDIPEDTYPNIPEDEMDEVLASQLPDSEMESEYSEYVLDQALSSEDQDYLMQALEQDEKLSGIFDKVMDTAGEFAGDGAVKGPGTGTSDSIPARLSDGEFVFTKKAVDQIGADKLQEMMDDAERDYDEDRDMKYGGGMMDSLLDNGGKNYDEEVHNQMLSANAMPSVKR